MHEYHFTVSTRRRSNVNGLDGNITADWVTDLPRFCAKCLTVGTMIFTPIDVAWDMIKTLPAKHDGAVPVGKMIIKGLGEITYVSIDKYYPIPEEDLTWQAHRGTSSSTYFRSARKIGKSG